MKNLCFFGGSFFKIKIADILNFQWIKYLDKGLSHLKNWGIVFYCCWNYGPSKLVLHFIEYRLDHLNNKHAKIAVNSAIQYFESCCQKKCLLKVWSFLVYPPQNYCKIEQKPILMANIINGQYFQTSRISDIWFNQNA